jgi:hypothetical protein
MLRSTKKEKTYKENNIRNKAKQHINKTQTRTKKTKNKTNKLRDML